jgi:hypothetical protein
MAINIARRKFIAARRMVQSPQVARRFRTERPLRMAQQPLLAHSSRLAPFYLR